MTIRANLESRPMLATFCGIPNPMSAEILGRAGFEAVCLDAEHGTFTANDLTDSIRALESVGSLALVRVADVGVAISQALDAGAAGVIVPRISSAEVARTAVKYARHPPQGERGVGFGRSNSYGSDASSLAEVNDASYLILQIETLPGLAALQQIAAVPGVDMLMIGPFDLAAALGVDVGSPEHSDAIEKVVQSARANGKRTAIFCSNVEQANDYFASGFDLVLLGADILLIAGGASELVAGVHRN